MTVTHLPPATFAEIAQALDALWVLYPASKRAMKPRERESLVREWCQMFRREPAEAVDWAVHQHKRQSNYFPKPAEIFSRIEEWKRRGISAEFDHVRDPDADVNEFGVCTVCGAFLPTEPAPDLKELKRQLTDPLFVHPPQRRVRREDLRVQHDLTLHAAAVTPAAGART